MDNILIFGCECRENTYRHHVCTRRAREIASLQEITTVNLLRSCLSVSIMKYNHRVYALSTIHLLLVLAKVPLPSVLKREIVRNLKLTNYETPRHIRQVVYRVLDSGDEEHIDTFIEGLSMTFQQVCDKYGVANYRNWVNISDQGVTYLGKHLDKVLQRRRFRDWINLGTAFPHICAKHLVPLYEYLEINHALFDKKDSDTDDDDEHVVPPFQRE